MKYLFVIYTDIEYKQHLDNFKTQEFYRKICDDPNIEVMEWGVDFHTDYKDLPLKTQQMMKWCSENKEYDYLIKCDDTIFDDKILNINGSGEKKISMYQLVKMLVVMDLLFMIMEFGESGKSLVN